MAEFQACLRTCVLSEAPWQDSPRKHGELQVSACAASPLKRNAEEESSVRGLLVHVVPGMCLVQWAAGSRNQSVPEAHADSHGTGVIRRQGFTAALWAPPTKSSTRTVETSAEQGNKQRQQRSKDYSMWEDTA